MNFFALNFIFMMKLFYVRAPQQYVAPSGVGTIKLTYTSNSAQPQTSIQYASTTPKVNSFSSRSVALCSGHSQCTNETQSISNDLQFWTGCLCDRTRPISSSCSSNTTQPILFIPTARHCKSIHNEPIHNGRIHKYGSITLCFTATRSNHPIYNRIEQYLFESIAIAKL